MSCRIIAYLLILSVLPNLVWASDWPAFRGAVNSAERGRAQGKGYPREWSPTDNIAWRYTLPGPGNSSPVIADNKVYVTYSDQQNGTRRNLICLDLESGKKLWTKSVLHEVDEPTHKTNPHCGSSPASSGERVVVWHGSAGVYCYSSDGKELWKYETGPVHHIWGTGSSPIIHDDKVFLNIGPGKNSYLLALSLKSGDLLWKVEEPGGNFGENPNGKKLNWIGSWSTPQIAMVAGEQQVICAMPTRVVGYAPDSGEILWWCDGLENLPRSNLVYTDPLLSETFAVTLGGFKGPGIGFALGEMGDITDSSRVWRVTRDNPQRIGTGIIFGKHIYAPTAGINGIQCLDLETGETLWTERTPAPFWGSMVLADELIYVTDQQGMTWVFRPNSEKLDLIAKNSLKERTNSTPAFTDDCIILRTYDAVYRVAK
ncbi:MAG: PQQ-binding-like beta-propeller repeat protein [Planctomycetaceae bacterium]|nr:PQQ-binding-like beta-propeller repeat protein [Planctomycetaceae bacterium]